MRRLGVEEEFLIIDCADGHAVALGEVLASLSADDGLSSEMKQEQIEVCTLPRLSLHDLAQDIAMRRSSADAAALSVGARAVALGTSPLPVKSTTTPGLRYERMTERFGLTAVEQLTCGCHVHVEVASDEEGVAILDRIRTWLPVLLAISSNSPFWNSMDSGYASYRAQAWNRWPTAGPCEVFGSAAAYHEQVKDILASGVLLDKGQIYFDARLSHRHPTVEVRVGDVCLFADDAVLLAALVRGLVETAARQWREGVPAVQVSAAQLRLASWQASRFGLDAELNHPLSGEPAPAFDVVMALLDHIEPVLADQGELQPVENLLFQLLMRGTGATRQRRTFAATGSLRDVIVDAAQTCSLPPTMLNTLHEQGVNSPGLRLPGELLPSE
ncbi:glutamate--cysteine ligase [Arthrobacter sp. D2-10]